VLIAPVCAGYFLGVSSVIFFVMGLILALQLDSLSFRFQDIGFPWKDEMFLDGTMCKSKYLGVMKCVLEGPKGESFLTISRVAVYDEYTRQDWFKLSNWGGCKCCSSVSTNTPSEANV
jgi:hypothetical protein